MRIGLLLANSSIIPRLAADIRTCVVDALAARSVEHEIVVETTSHNESAAVVRDALQDLVIKHDVDVVVAPLNPSVAAAVEPTMRGQHAPLVA